MDNAQPVQSHPFSGPTAFMIGNEANALLWTGWMQSVCYMPPSHSFASEGFPLTLCDSLLAVLQGHGLSEKQVAACDAFVYVPQYGDGTASLNVTVATSIVLQHFAQWAGYQEHGREGQKFVVGERPQRTTARGAARAYGVQSLQLVCNHRDA
jgi:hypothetical protein